MLKCLTALSLCTLAFGCQTSKEPPTNIAADLTKGLAPKADCKPLLNSAGLNDTYTALCTMPDESVIIVDYDLTHPMELQAKVFKPAPNAQTTPSQSATPPATGSGSASPTPTPTAKKK